MRTTEERLAMVRRAIGGFTLTTQVAEYTDTDAVWVLLDAIQLVLHDQMDETSWGVLEEFVRDGEKAKPEVLAQYLKDWRA